MEKFNLIVAQVFKLQPHDISLEMTSKNVPEWDSMNYLFLIAELEKEYNVTFTMDEVMNAQCLGDIYTIVNDRKK
jgi:acyl carrier protein